MTPEHGTSEDGQATSIRFKGDEATVAAKKAFVVEACTSLCEDDDDCRCEVTQDLGDWLVLRLRDTKASGFGWYWYVAAATKPGYRLSAPTDVDLPPYNEDPPSMIYEICREFTTDEAPPAGHGLINAKVSVVEEEGDRDGDAPFRIPVLSLECDDRDSKEHYWFECSAADERCDRSSAPK